ncbi:hypothetical protein ACX9R5_05000 [Rathayibacter sp. CAU 1779]
MRRAMIGTLSDSEFTLVAETEKDSLAALDEDALLELHGRIRRARNKYTGIYRRNAAARIDDVAARGKAYAQNQRDRDKAEVFEDALARVSRQIAVVARQAAVELRTERLEAVQSRGSGPDLASAPASGVGPGVTRSHQKTTGGVKRDAGTRAMGARRQAKKDSR